MHLRRMFVCPCIESVCLAVYVANGHIMVFSLPSLKLLLDNDYIPFPDIRSAMLHLYYSIHRPCMVDHFLLLYCVSHLLREKQ